MLVGAGSTECKRETELRSPGRDATAGGNEAADKHHQKQRDEAPGTGAAGRLAGVCVWGTGGRWGGDPL